MITCGHTSIPVRLNLLHALWKLRDFRGSEFIWIDALCIDQENLEECSAQVALMRTIYAVSQKTFICLNDRVELSPEASDIMWKLRLEARPNKGQRSASGSNSFAYDDDDWNVDTNAWFNLGSFYDKYVVQKDLDHSGNCHRQRSLGLCWWCRVLI